MNGCLLNNFLDPIFILPSGLNMGAGGAGLATFILALYLLIPESIVRMFMENEEIVTTGAGFLRGFGLSLPFMCIDFVVVGVSQSFGFGKYAFVFSILRKAVFEIPFILIFSRIFGLYGLCFCVTCAEFLMSVIALAVLRKLLKKV